MKFKHGPGDAYINGVKVGTVVSFNEGPTDVDRLRRGESVNVTYNGGWTALVAPADIVNLPNLFDVVVHHVDVEGTTVEATLLVRGAEQALAIAQLAVRMAGRRPPTG